MTGRWWRTGAGVLLALLVATAAAFLWVRQVNAPPRIPPLQESWTAITRVLAGDGIAGQRDGDAGRARFSDPFGVATAPDGSVLVADGAGSIRRISPEGVVTTLVGASGQLSTPSGIAIDSRVNRPAAIYVADSGHHAVRRIMPDGTVSTLAGGPLPGTSDGSGAQARFRAPLGVAVAPDGRVVVADTYNDAIRIVTPDGQVTTLAGGDRPGADDGFGPAARFDTPSGVAVDAHGVVFVADTGNNRIRRVTLDGTVSTVSPEPPDGWFRPVGVAVSGAGTLYVTQDGGRVTEVVPGVSARTLAGAGPGYTEGVGTGARFRAPAGIAVLAPGRLVVADRRNALVRLVADRSRAGLAPSSPLIAPRFDRVAAMGFQPLLWPLSPMEGPFEVTGTMGEMRGDEAGARFHAGVDVHADEGTAVRAVRDGVVLDPIAVNDVGTLNESIRIGPIVYVHARVGRTRRAPFDDPRVVPLRDERGRVVRMRVPRGARYRAGEAVGTANPFNHVHLNVGWPREEINALRIGLLGFRDTVPPVIPPGGITLLSEDGTRLAARERGRLIVHGAVQVVVDAWDQVDGNRPTRRLGLYRLGYQLLHANGAPVPGFCSVRETIRFDRLSPDPEAAHLVYAPGSGIPLFGTRRTRFLYAVTNAFRDGVARRARWDTTTLPAGDYTLRVLAADASGNEALANRDLAVTIPARAEALPGAQASPATGSAAQPHCE